MNKTMVAKELMIVARSLVSEQAQWGFDLTDIKGSVFAQILKSVGINPDDGKEEDRAWEWKGSGILIVTGNNPITGERKGEKDYASYIGIEGTEDKVKKVADAIREKGDWKDESPNEREYI